MKKKLLKAKIESKFQELLTQVHNNYVKDYTNKLIDVIVNEDDGVIYNFIEGSHEHTCELKNEYELSITFIDRFIPTNHEHYEGYNREEAIMYLWNNKKWISKNKDILPYTEEEYRNSFGDLKERARQIVFAESKRPERVFVATNHKKNTSNLRCEKINAEDLPALSGSKRVLEYRNKIDSLYNSPKWEDPWKESHCQVRQYKVNHKQQRKFKRAQIEALYNNN